jgi:hypothetical protein
MIRRPGYSNSMATAHGGRCVTAIYENLVVSVAFGSDDVDLPMPFWLDPVSRLCRDC